MITIVVLSHTFALPNEPVMAELTPLILLSCRILPGFQSNA